MRDGLWDLVTGYEAEPTDEGEAKEKYRLRNNKALGTMLLTISTNLLYLLGAPTDSKTVWQVLEEQYQKKSWANVFQKRRKLQSLKLRDGQSVQAHVKQLTEVMELAIIDVPVKEADRVMYLLDSLPDSMSVLVTAMEACPTIPTWSVVMEKLLHEEAKLISKTTQIKEEEALAAMCCSINRRG